jgi:glycine/D-amino acid oxidase-like deaminating enzyme
LLLFLQKKKNPVLFLKLYRMNRPASTSLWEVTCAASRDWPALGGQHAAQIAIIGGGYTGLSAALHVAEAGKDVALLDAETPGWGGSGRNGGQVIAGVKDDPEALTARFGEGIAHHVGSGPDLVFSLIERHAIACAPVRTGWLQPAVSTATLATLRSRARQWQALGVPIRLLDAAETAAHTGSTLYPGALLDPRGGTVQPLAYARGLADALAALGGRIFARSPATRIERTANGWRAETPSGAITAEKLILATNAYSGPLHETLRRSVVAIPSFQVATEKLPPGLLASILPGGQAASDLRRLLRYFRVFDGRLLMGARGVFADPAPPALIARLRAAIAEIFPAAAGLKLDYAWGGMVAVTADHLPHLHEPEPGLLAGLGYNGRGVAMATLMGASLAKSVLGEPAAFPKTPLRPIRFHRFARVGAIATIQYLRAKDAAEKEFSSFFEKKDAQKP